MPEPVLLLLAAVKAIVFTAFAAVVLFLGLYIGAGQLVLRLFRRRQRQVDFATAARLRARMKRSARTTLLFTPAQRPTFSKLGGDPELPVGLEWPRGENAPGAFLAQIDLAE